MTETSDWNPARRRRRGARSEALRGLPFQHDVDLALFAALVVAGWRSFSCRSSRRRWAASRKLGDRQSRPAPLPRVWVWKNYWDIPTGYRHWAGARQFAPDFSLHRRAHAGAVRRWRRSPSRTCKFFGDQAILLSYLQLGLTVSGGDGDSVPMFIKVRDLGLAGHLFGSDPCRRLAFSLASQRSPLSAARSERASS